MQNGYIERFNRTYREAVLESYIFENLEEASRNRNIYERL
ncbi:MAG: transposase [Bacteroidetes bacterium]|nr:transposase [Bacteroidota bacterium]